MKRLVEDATNFEAFFFHLRKGGHVAALHEHRRNRYFARIDLKNFFYSISRNRVARALHEIDIPRAGFYAKFSCVKNPYDEPTCPTYALPYGFVQSPVLATLVLSRSVLGCYLRAIQSDVTLSVYMDDIAISSP
ncbi:MAG: reverse transcriptase domain-containing protein, partial [bacterium]